MKDKENVFIDLSKLSEEERRIVRMTLYKNREYVPFFTDLFEIDKYFKLHYYKGDWLCGDTWYNEKTEILYPDFIKLFEGGEGESNGWIKIESENDLPKKEVDVHFIFTDEAVKYQTFGVWDNRLKSFYSGALKIENVIYYQPLIKPLPPKF